MNLESLIYPDTFWEARNLTRPMLFYASAQHQVPRVLGSRMLFSSLCWRSSHQMPAHEDSRSSFASHDPIFIHSVLIISSLHAQFIFSVAITLFGKCCRSSHEILNPSICSFNCSVLQTSLLLLSPRPISASILLWRSNPLSVG